MTRVDACEQGVLPIGMPWSQDFKSCGIANARAISLCNGNQTKFGIDVVPVDHN